MGKVTAKIPQELLEVIKRESERTGVGIQKLAGMLLAHGFNDLKKRQEEQHVHTED